MTRQLPPHLRAIAPKGAHVGGEVTNSSGSQSLVGTGFRRDFAVPRTIPVMVREGTTADWADIWPFFRVLLATGETMCLPNIMMGTDARTLWFGGRDTEVVVAVDPRDKPQIDNPDTPILGRVIGTASLRSARDGHGKHVAHAQFAVDPRQAGEGVEKELGIAVLTKARAGGFRAVEIAPVVATDPAVACWRELGFEIVGTLPNAFEHPSAGMVGLHTMFRAL